MTNYRVATRKELEELLGGSGMTMTELARLSGMNERRVRRMFSSGDDRETAPHMLYLLLRACQDYDEFPDFMREVAADMLIPSPAEMGG